MIEPVGDVGSRREVGGDLDLHRAPSIATTWRGTRRVVVRWASPGADPAAEGHRLLRRVVATVAGVDTSMVRIQQRCPDCGGAHGRPQVTIRGRRGPKASLARADGLIVVAVAARDVGIDLERSVPGRRSAAPVALSGTERAALGELASDDADDLVLRAWVRKEAILKATGHGLRIDPSSITLAADPLRVVSWDGPGRRPVLALADLEIAPGYVAAIACRTRAGLLLDARPARFTDG